MIYELTDRQRELLRKQFALLTHARELERFVKSGICLPPNSEGRVFLVENTGSDEQKAKTAMALAHLRGSLSDSQSVTLSI